MRLKLAVKFLISTITDSLRPYSNSFTASSVALCTGSDTFEYNLIQLVFSSTAYFVVSHFSRSVDPNSAIAHFVELPRVCLPLILQTRCNVSAGGVAWELPAFRRNFHFNLHENGFVPPIRDPAFTVGL